MSCAAYKGKRLAEMSLSEDQHAVGELGADGQHEAFGVAVRARAPRRDLDHLDARICEHRVERARVVSGPITDEEPEPRCLFAEVRDEVAGLLRGPRSVWVLGDAEDVQVAVADLEREQDVETPQRDRAVDVEEVDRTQAGGLGAPELPPAGVGVPYRCRWDAVALASAAPCSRSAGAQRSKRSLSPSGTRGNALVSSRPSGG